MSQRCLLEIQGQQIQREEFLTPGLWALWKHQCCLVHGCSVYSPEPDTVQQEPSWRPVHTCSLKVAVSSMQQGHVWRVRHLFSWSPKCLHHSCLLLWPLCVWCWIISRKGRHIELIINLLFWHVISQDLWYAKGSNICEREHKCINGSIFVVLSLE